MLIADKHIGDGLILDSDRYVLILGVVHNLIRIGVGSRKEEMQGYGHSENFWVKNIPSGARAELHDHINKTGRIIHLCQTINQ